MVPAGRFVLSNFELMSRSESCLVKFWMDCVVFSLDVMLIEMEGVADVWVKEEDGGEIACVDCVLSPSVLF